MRLPHHGRCEMTCEEFSEELELYTLGALESSEAYALTEHLATGCVSCRESLRRALEQNALISQSVPLVQPPPRLRERIRSSIAPSPRSITNQNRYVWALAAAALLLIAAGLSTLAAFRSKLAETRAVLELAQLRSNGQERLDTLGQIIAATGTRVVSFDEPKIEQLHGAVYVHQKLGIALIVDRLPSAPAGWKYESWLVPKMGAPEPVESFHPDSAGRAVSLVAGPVPVGDLAAVAVSMEPQNSHPTKPTKLVFATKI